MAFNKQAGWSSDPKKVTVPPVAAVLWFFSYAVAAVVIYWLIWLEIAVFRVLAWLIIDVVEVVFILGSLFVLGLLAYAIIGPFRER